MSRAGGVCGLLRHGRGGLRAGAEARQAGALWRGGEAALDYQAGGRAAFAKKNRPTALGERERERERGCGDGRKGVRRSEARVWIQEERMPWMTTSSRGKQAELAA